MSNTPPTNAPVPDSAPALSAPPAPENIPAIPAQPLNAASPAPDAVPVSSSAPNAASSASNAVPVIPAQPPAIPLTPANYALYKDLLNKIEFELQHNKDPIALETLNDSKGEVSSVLDNNDIAVFTHNTGLYSEILTQVKTTNANLVTLQDEINKVASHINTASTILAAIDALTKAIPAF